VRKSLCAIAIVSAATFTGQAYADDYGCRVLMCLSNPNGATAEPQCDPPIRKFLEGQAKDPKEPFPSCPEGAPATMKPAYRPYDQCPDGTRALDDSIQAIQLPPSTFSQLALVSKPPANRPWLNDLPIDVPSGVTFLTGIGEGSGQNLAARANKVCVGKSLGTLTFNVGTQEAPATKTVLVFEQVTTMEPAKSPYVVDVNVGPQLLRSVRF